MKKISLAPLCALLLLTLTSISCGNSPKPEGIAPLTVQGTQLYAGDEPVRLKGISFGWHNIWPRFYNEGALAYMHDEWGANLFRAAIGADDHAMADNPGIKNGYIGEPEFALENLYAVVDAAIAHDSYIIVDWHSHVLHPEAAKEFFTAVATRYADSPNVIYELFNEPVSNEFESERSYAQPSDESLKDYWLTLKSYSEELIGIITGISNVHPLILVGCPQWDQDIHLVPEAPITCYDNIMYTVHYYAASHKQYLRDRSDYALSQGIPVFISECAGCENTGDGYLDLESWVEWENWAEDRGVSTVVWSVSDKVETCSMLTSEAASEGGWNDSVLKPWTRIVIDWIRK